MPKTCTKCGIEKDETEFYRCAAVKSGLRASCKDCDTSGTQRWRAQNPDKYLTPAKQREQRKRQAAKVAGNPLHRLRMLAKYGITPEQYERVHSALKGRCVVCGNPETALSNSGQIRPLSVDHNHTTGKYRGLLCSRCNTALGLLQEDADTIWKLWVYIRVHQGDFSENDVQGIV